VSAQSREKSYFALLARGPDAWTGVTAGAGTGDATLALAMLVDCVETLEAEGSASAFLTRLLVTG